MTAGRGTRKKRCREFVDQVATNPEKGNPARRRLPTGGRLRIDRPLPYPCPNRPRKDQTEPGPTARWRARPPPPDRLWGRPFEPGRGRVGQVPGRVLPKRIVYVHYDAPNFDNNEMTGL